MSDEKRNASQGLEESELEAALQLLVERAQYITGATGTALALPQGGEMVCRASAGSCAPSVGSRLQVRSGLTGESISRRQLLRCDNAETDPRVNLETCRALGIASIVVLPMLRRNGEVRGLFELFSDHPYAFEERDLIALERMADLTITALDLAEQRHGSIPSARPRAPVASAQEKTAPANGVGALKSVVQARSTALAGVDAAAPSAPMSIAATNPETNALSVEQPPSDTSVGAVESGSPSSAQMETVETADAVVPESIRRVQKCTSCGFPISEGRTVCLDCEKKQSVQDGAANTDSPTGSALSSDENIPAFLADSQPVRESWITNPVNWLAIIVVILGILVAIVVFRP